jgi:hypothetical protein
MGVGEQQPLALGQRGETLQPWGLTIENAWEGKILEITDVVIFVPEGLKVVDPGDEKIWAKIDCMLLPEEEQESCDDSLVEVYRMNGEELGKGIYKNLTTKNLRVYVEVADPDKVLGKAPIAVQNFKSSVRYHYALDRSVPALVHEVAAQ